MKIPSCKLARWIITEDEKASDVAMGELGGHMFPHSRPVSPQVPPTETSWQKDFVQNIAMWYVCPPKKSKCVPYKMDLITGGS